MRRIIVGLSIALLTFIFSVALAWPHHFWKKQGGAKVIDARSGRPLPEASVYLSGDDSMLIDVGRGESWDRLYLFTPRGDWGPSVGALLVNKSHIIKLPGYVFTHEMPPP